MSVNSMLFAPILPVTLACAALLACTQPATSLPLFSRSLGESCASCHSAVPRLNAAGMAFAQGGYRAPGHAFVRPWADHGVPVSVVASAGLGESRSQTGLPVAGAAATSRTMHRNSLELRSAGAVAPRVSYQLGVGFDKGEPERGSGFVQLDDIVSDGALNLRAGRFDAELPFTSRVRRTTMVDYLSPVTFEARGLELNGRRASWNWAAGLSQSDRNRVGGIAPRTIRPPFEDTYLRLGRSVGAQSVAAQMLFDRQDSYLRTLTWVQHLRAQVAATLGPPRFTLVPSWVIDRFDDRPLPEMHERQQYFMLETLALLDPAGRWSMTGRYEHAYRTGNGIDPQEHRQLSTLDLAWQAVPNARVAVEWAHTNDRLLRSRQGEVDAFVQAGW